MTRNVILSTVAVAALLGFTIAGLPAFAGTTKTTTTTETIPAPDGDGTIIRTTITEEPEPTSPVTISKTTSIRQKAVPGAVPLDFTNLDLNKDGILSRKEVGEKLFFVFDRDGNKVIDNIEIKHNQIITMIPLEKTQLTMIDLDDDGRPDITDVTSEDFMDQSMLGRFDKDNDGLSAEEFIGLTFYRLDTNNSGVVEYPEWKETYFKSRSPLNAKQWRYNQ